MQELMQSDTSPERICTQAGRARATPSFRHRGAEKALEIIASPGSYTCRNEAEKMACSGSVTPD